MRLKVDAEYYKNIDNVEFEYIHNEAWPMYFDNVQELQDFFLVIAERYPNGVDDRYVFGLMNEIRVSKTLNSLISKGLIEETEDEEGNLLYNIVAK